MSECEKYRDNIEDILRKSDLSTVTTKKVRRALESETGTSLNSIKKEINAYIEDIFTNFQEKEEQRQKYVATPTKVATPKKSTVKKPTAKAAEKPAKVTKKVVTKKKEVQKEKKPKQWPIYIVKAPLCDMIQTKFCTRPQTVKKIWEYIRTHELQDEADKRVIRCDELFKEICDGKETITAFNLNKYIQKYFETIPKEEQEKYKNLYEEQERLNGSSVDGGSSP